MPKGEQTRQRIIATAAPVFNTRGYAGTSMSDLLHATGLEKGGIYNHFASKEALALAAFDYAVALTTLRYAEVLRTKTGAMERLLSIASEFEGLVTNPDIPGGCPLFNTAVEADDGNPALRDRVQDAMSGLLRLIGSTVKMGIASGEIRPDVDPRAVASLTVSSLEGAVVLSRLFDDPAHIRRAVAHLAWYFRSLA